MKPALFLGAALAILAATPVLAEDLLDGGGVEDILGLAKSYGDAELTKQQNGDPRISGNIDGIAYQVFFMNCTDNASCEDLNFYAGFRDIKPTLDAINSWNRDKRFGNAYLDADLDAVIEYDVNLEYGVSRNNMDAAFGVWALLAGQFADYIGYDKRSD